MVKFIFFCSYLVKEIEKEGKNYFSERQMTFLLQLLNEKRCLAVIFYQKINQTNETRLSGAEKCL